MIQGKILMKESPEKIRIFKEDMKRSAKILSRSVIFLTNYSEGKIVAILED